MSAWKPTVFRAEALSGTGLWQLGIETWVQEYEVHFQYGSRSDGSDRFFMLHLGFVSLQWRRRLS